MSPSDAGTAILVFLFTGFAISLALVRGLDFILGLIK